jgi:hypothetical protein
MTYYTMMLCAHLRPNTQVQSSAGALKQLQGQVLDQKRSAEVAHTGQLEARERLVGEMESTARKAQLVVIALTTFI